MATDASATRPAQTVPRTSMYAPAVGQAVSSAATVSTSAATQTTGPATRTAAAATSSGGSQSRTLRVWTATWNVGNKAPLADLSPWIPARGGGYDVIAVGCQEGTYKKKASRAGAEGAAARAEAEGELEAVEEDEDNDSEAEEVELINNEEEIFSASPAGGAAAAPRADDGRTGGSAVPSAEPSKAQIATAAMRGVVGFIDARNDAQSKRASPEGSPASSARHHRDLSAQAKNRAFVDASCPFFDVVKAYLGPEYVTVQSVLMWQIGLLVLVRKEHALAVRDVEEGTEATGILGVGANKGGVAVKLRLYDTSLVFINAHLAAHLPHVDARNRNTAEILDNIRFGTRNIDIDSQFHHAFFMGDLNYRVDPAIKDTALERGKEDKARAAQYKTMIEGGGDFLSLLECDQLRDAQMQGKALVGFSEADIRFVPTFKVVRTAGMNYQTTRTPSWCDRVLWKSLPGHATDLRCTGYASHPSISTSDHKPVSASFEIDVIKHAAAISRGVGATPAPFARITNLRARDLFASDFSKSSDPYVIFYSSPSSVLEVGKHHPRTTWKRQTLNPVWNQPGDVPAELLLNFVHPGDYERASLVMVLMDKDIDHDDRLGQAVLHLHAYATTPGARDFSLPVIRGGVQYGVISGTLEIVWPPSRRASGLGRASAFVRKADDGASAGCHCAIM